MSNPSQRTVSLSAAAVIAAIVLFLVVQDQRHGWPFSRHMVQPASEHSSSHASATARSAATRVPVEIPAQQIEALGVQFEPVELRPLANPVRAVATVVADESRISHVHTRWVSSALPIRRVRKPLQRSRRLRRRVSGP
jgi:Cu(I)/Ag(I) efflux system membrane fusion protein